MVCTCEIDHQYHLTYINHWVFTISQKIVILSFFNFKFRENRGSFIFTWLIFLMTLSNNKLIQYTKYLISLHLCDPHPYNYTDYNFLFIKTISYIITKPTRQPSLSCTFEFDMCINTLWHKVWSTHLFILILHM